MKVAAVNGVGGGVISNNGMDGVGGEIRATSGNEYTSPLSP